MQGTGRLDSTQCLDESTGVGGPQQGKSFCAGQNSQRRREQGAGKGREFISSHRFAIRNRLGRKRLPSLSALQSRPFRDSPIVLLNDESENDDASCGSMARREGRGVRCDIAGEQPVAVE